MNINDHGRIDNIYADSGVFGHWRRGSTPVKALREILANSMSVGLDWNAFELCLGTQDKRWWYSDEHSEEKLCFVAVDDGKGCAYQDSSRLHVIGRDPTRLRLHGLNNVGFQQAATILGGGCVCCWRVQSDDGERQDWIGIYGDVTRRDETGLPVFAKYKFPTDRRSMTAWQTGLSNTEVEQAEQSMQAVLQRFFGAARGPESSAPPAPFRDPSECCDFMDTHLQDNGAILMYLPDVEVVAEVNRSQGVEFTWDGKDCVTTLARAFLPRPLGKMMLPRDYYDGYKDFRVTMVGSGSQAPLPVEVNINVTDLPSRKPYEFTFDGKPVAK